MIGRILVVIGVIAATAIFITSLTYPFYVVSHNDAVKAQCGNWAWSQAQSANFDQAKFEKIYGNSLAECMKNNPLWTSYWVDSNGNLIPPPPPNPYPDIKVPEKP